MATFEKIIESTRTLSPGDKRKLRQALDAELALANPRRTFDPNYRMKKREDAWVAAHRNKYLGQWVAVEGDLLVAHETLRLRTMVKGLASWVCRGQDARDTTG